MSATSAERHPAAPTHIHSMEHNNGLPLCKPRLIDAGVCHDYA
jgi:hypothetical protein